MKNRNLLLGAVLAAVVILAAVSLQWMNAGAAATDASAQAPAAPTFQEDTAWLKVPAKWKLGNVASVAVDSRDHVWILHRPRTLPADQLAMAAPPVVEFDAAGNFVQAWGGNGNGYEWPQREHGIYVDHTDHVWIGGNNNKERKLPLLEPINDDQILKFTRTGQFVLQIGRSDKSAGDADTGNVRQPADMVVFPKTNELFVADGYGNHRLIVFDAGSGAFKRMWGAFGNPPLDVDRRPPPAASRPAGQTGPEHFDTVHSVRVSNDDLVYVADRGNKRVQVFTLDGTFISQASIAPDTKGLTARALAFSPDPQQRFLYVGGQPEIWVLERKTLRTLGSIATPNAHHFAADSKGNIYTAETEESRSRKFVLKGQT
jgi:DNA-binding beta-propeller fold protein YncE